MAVTKAQLVVWALIAGLSVGCYTVLSRMNLPDDTFVEGSAPRAVVAIPQAVAAVPDQAITAIEDSLPATIPEFPFPDDLANATVGDQPAVAVPQAAAFAEIPGDAIPQIAEIADAGVETMVEADVTAADATPVATAVAAVATEEPPIPMPSRPIMAQPDKAVPLSEVKTLYVVADALNVRAVPSTSGTVLQKLPQGFAVAAREQSDDWIGFQMRDGSTGWMRTDYLSDTMPPPEAVSPVRVWTEPLNLMM